MAWKAIIAGDDHTTDLNVDQPAEIVLELAERSKATFRCQHGYVPAKRDTVILYDQDGVTKLFAGLVYSRKAVSEEQYQLVDIECVDYFWVTDWITISLEYTVSTNLYTVLTAIVAVLAPYGVTLSGAQVNPGPTLAAFTWTNVKVADALRELTGRTSGWVARMTPEKVLSMVLPGDDPADFEITDSDPHCDDVTWDDSEAEYATKVILVCGPTGVGEVEFEKHYGNGVTREFVLDIACVGLIGALRIDGGPGGYPVGIYGVDDMPWTFDAATRTIHQRADQDVIASGHYIEISYWAQYPFTVIAEASVPPDEVVEYRREVLDQLFVAPAQELANGLLVALYQNPRSLTIHTREGGLTPGQTLTVDVARGSLDLEALITRVRITLVLDHHWEYEVNAQEGDQYQGSELEYFRSLGGASSGSVIVGGGGGGGGSIVTLSSPAFLGGSRVASIPMGSPPAYTPVINYVPFVAAASFSGRVRVDLWARSAGVGVTARLWNVTDGVETNHSSKITATTPTETTFIVAIVIGKRYRLDVISDTNGESPYGIGTLEAA